MTGRWSRELTRRFGRVVDAFLPAGSRVPDYDERQLLRERGFIRATLLIFLGLVVITGLSARAYGPGETVTVLWGLYALVLFGNLVLVRITGRFHEVNFANNLLGLLLMAGLMLATEGLTSAYLPLFLAGVAITSNFGGMRSILTFMAGLLATITAVWWIERTGESPPADLDTRFGFLVTAACLLLLGNLSSQYARSRARAMLRRARDQAVTGRRQAERAKADAEAALKRLQEAQQQMILQEKMASLGSLVAGVAHEVNTPVGLALTGASQLRIEAARLAGALAENRLRKADLEEFIQTAEELSGLIEKNAGRAARLIQSFKEVAVDQSSDARRRFDLDLYVREVMDSLSPQLRRLRHRVELDIAAGITIDGYPGTFAQVLTNLVMNSVMHAFEEGQQGTIRFQARALPPDGERAEPWVELVYSDDGKGIPPELWDRIFEPFFTTRRGSGGSGLGLHLAFNIVTVGMGGRLEVGAAPEGGARFSLRFPAHAPLRARELAEESL